MNTQVKINHTEPLYTLSEAQNILTWEQYKRKQLQHEKRLYFIKQRFSGIVLILLSIAVPFLIKLDLLGSDMGIFTLIFLPLGTFLTFTRQYIMGTFD